jgi:hypothetical protein
MGPSMGGLISRYALAFMEKKYDDTNLDEWQHNTRLWVSVDSPHLGANIPIGVQSFLNQAKNDNTDAEDFVEKELGSPAAQQLLIEQFNGWNSTQLKSDYLDGRTISQGYSEDRGHPFFINFYNNLYNNGLQNSNGYPQNLDKIAMVNGSLTGLKSYLDGDLYPNNNQLTTNIRAFQHIRYWAFGWHHFTIHIGSFETYNMPTLGSNHKISRFKKAFDDKSKHITNINSRGNMDNNPGGFFPVYDEITAGLDGSDPLPYPTGTFQSFGNLFDTIFAHISDDFGGAHMSLRTNKHVSSFIATPSSLGLINPDFNWSEDLNRNLVCSNETPFDSYYGEEENTGHVSFSNNGFIWLQKWLDEDDGIEPTPTVYLNRGDLIGGGRICHNEVKTLYFEPCKVGGSITWSTHHPSLQILSSTDLSVTVKNTNQYARELWVKATFEDGTSITKSMVCRPHINISVNSSTSRATIVGASLPITSQGITHVYWHQTGGAGTLIANNTGLPGGGNGGSVGYSNYRARAIGGNVMGTLTIGNSCGITTAYFFIPASQTDNDFNELMNFQKIANNKYKVEVKDPIANPQISTQINDSKLFNTYGVEDYNIQHLNDEIDINNSQSGTIKIIKVIVDGEVLIKRVIVD